MISSTRRKERLSLAYLAAIAAKAGVEFNETVVDEDDIDGQFRSYEGVRGQIDFQAKGYGCKSFAKSMTEFDYDLKAKNYNGLVRNTINPRLLIVVVFPSKESNWIDQSERRLRISRCAYWLSLRGLPETSNSATVRVKIPRKNVLNELGLKNLLKTVNAGKMP
ncbi:DUF4365 domain-containing protein [Litoreibacter halocynthiae]|uniref:DUF4365 domain-containing protein n=1 Tax=Litoreibacter halocynthiae TaxID=1242689 RepID=UPI002493BFDA|nr:DUF4365 domain-containing protein [Litoreibacter halocynthiae]